jgi:hypothetical protein
MKLGVMKGLLAQPVGRGLVFTGGVSWDAQGALAGFGVSGLLR